MKKFLSILLATLMIVSLVPAMLVSAAVEPAQKATAISADMNGRTYHFYQSFDTDNVVQGADKVMELLGWQLPEDGAKATAHLANVAATESGADGVFMYELKNGRLYIRNRGASNEYMILADTAELGQVFTGAYTVEYTLTYLPSSTSTGDGYMSLIYGSDKDLELYGEVALRISGWGNNRLSSGALDAGDVSTSLVKETSLTAYRLDNDRNRTLYERLYGNIDVQPGTANNLSLKGSRVMVDKEMRVRMEFDGVVGPRVYVNDVLVSDPRSIADPAKAAVAAKSYTDLLGDTGSCLAFCVTPGVECVLDEITVYGDRKAEIASSLYITEVATLPANPNAPFIEVYNNSLSSIDLADFAAGYVVVDEKGKETVSAVALKDYIGQTLTVGEAVLENISAEDAVLASCETAVIFPVNTAADMAALVATEGDVTMAGFRALYDLPADAKVIAVVSDDFTVSATEHRWWFVGDLLDDKGYATDWSAFSLSLLKTSSGVQSLVELVPSVAFGYQSDINDLTLNEEGKMNFGGAGIIMPGYSAHYIYGADVSAAANQGTMITRTEKTIAEMNNVGKVLNVQTDYFYRIADFRAGRFSFEGALAITEIVPVTAENDAFESFELTNIADEALDLYDYALVSKSGDDYFTLAGWNKATLFTTEAAGIRNPNEGGKFMVAPGASVVIWNKNEAAADKTVADFRNYYGLDADVAVIVADATDENSVVAVNSGTATYGVATAADAAATLNTPNNLFVSDVTVPLHTLQYAINGLYRFTFEELAEAGNWTVINALINSGYPGCEMLGLEDLAVGASVAGCFTRERVGGQWIYTPCDSEDVAEAGVNYFVLKEEDTFYAYGSVQDLSIPEGAAVAVSYGSGIYAAKTSGSMMQTMTVKSFDYDLAGRGYGDLPYLTDEAYRFITVKTESGLSEATLGEITDKQGIDVASGSADYYTVSYLDETGEVYSMVTLSAVTCGDVYTILDNTYDRWYVDGVFYNAGDKVLINGKTEIMPASLGETLQTNAAQPDMTPSTSVEIPSVSDLAEGASGSAASKGGANTVIVIVCLAVVGVAVIAAACWFFLQKRKA